jgi:hypothetical protein
MSRGAFITGVLSVVALSSAAPMHAQQKLSPDALRDRDRLALLDLRTIAMGQKQYAERNGGFFGEIACLTQPETCLPAFKADEAPFLDPSHDWLQTRLGFVRRFWPGPTITPEEIPRSGAAPGSLRGYAFTVTPERPGQTGLKSYCADGAGRICAMEDGTEPPVIGGRCDKRCKELK